MGAMLASLTDWQSNIRPSIMDVDVDLLECCVDALHDMGYPDADRRSGSARHPSYVAILDELAGRSIVYVPPIYSVRLGRQ